MLSPQLGRIHNEKMRIMNEERLKKAFFKAFLQSSIRKREKLLTTKRIKYPTRNQSDVNTIEDITNSIAYC